MSDTHLSESPVMTTYANNKLHPLTKTCIKCCWTKPLGKFAVASTGRSRGTSARCLKCLKELYPDNKEL